MVMKPQVTKRPLKICLVFRPIAKGGAGVRRSTPNLPKGSLYSHKMDQKWGFIGGVIQKAHFLRVQKSTFWGPAPPKN